MKIFSIIATTYVVMNVTEVEKDSSREDQPRVQQKIDKPPWLVSIQLTNLESGWHICAGILVHNSWVLTAAHCLDSELAERMWVVTGSEDLSRGHKHQQVIGVKFFLIHPGYKQSRKPYWHDIALLRLKEPVILDSYTSLANLSERDHFSGSCSEIGWGSRKQNWKERRSTTVKQSKVTFVPKIECQRSYGNVVIPAYSICGRTDFYAADEGGAVFCIEAEEHSGAVAGLLSWRHESNQTRIPQVYVSVKNYLQWIQYFIQPVYTRKNTAPKTTFTAVLTPNETTTKITATTPTTTASTTTTATTTILSTTPTLTPTIPRTASPTSTTTIKTSNITTTTNAVTETPTPLQIENLVRT